MSATTSKLVFLIDEQSLMTSLLSLDELKLSIMRILIYYHFQKRQIQWGFRLFSTQTRYPSESMRHFYTMTPDSFEILEKEYVKRDKTRPKQVVLGTPIMRIKQVLKEVIGDFQWENNDLGSTDTAKNYIFIMSACPSNLIEMNQFFISPHPDDNKLLNVASLPQYFDQTRLELSSTLLQSYNARNIALSIIDTYKKPPIIKPLDQWINRISRQGFAACFEHFGGKYIPLRLLIRGSNLYGRSFLTDIQDLLPNQKPISVLPVWKGSFKTLFGKKFVNFALYPSLRKNTPTDLAFVAEIRVLQMIHVSQFSCSWLASQRSDYTLVHDAPHTSRAFKDCISELFKKQSILIAELVPMEGFEQYVQNKKVLIEALSPTTASLRFLNIQHVPRTLNNKPSIVEHYPIGTCRMVDDSLPLELPKELLTEENVSYKIKKIPDFVRQLALSDQPKMSIEQKQEPMPLPKKEQVVEKKRAPLPTNVNMLEKALKDLYFEAVYTQKNTMDNIIITIKKWITSLSRSCIKEDIIRILFNHTITLEDLEAKYKNSIIPQIKDIQNATLEQTYQYEWWQEIKSRSHSNPRFEKLSSLAVKTREAQVQVILYCFICRLVSKAPANSTKRDPALLAEDFFQKVVVTLTMHDLGNFLSELDSEEGPQATKRRDLCDLSDHAFMEVLAKRFQALPHLIQKFKELSGTDEMASSSSSSDLEDDVTNLDVPSFKSASNSLHVSPRNKPIRQQKRNISDTSSSSSSVHKNSLLSSPQRSTSKTFAPIKIKKTNSNTLDMFLKRTVDVKPNVTTPTETIRGEAAQAAIAKVNRSALNGRPTMKRTGSFTSSAQATERQKKKKMEPSMLSSQQETTGTVILRRNNNIPNTEETTPRTSMNRYLGTNLFADFAETCPSPSTRTNRNSDQVQVPKTPEITPVRYRKIMMDRTPHRLEEPEGGIIEDFNLPDEPTSKTPYTPRTAAIRERDRIDRSMPGLGRNLTMRLQDIFDQEKAKDDEFSLKSRQSSGIFFDDVLNDSPISSQQDNNNPFLTASSQASTATVSPHRPQMKRGATIDDLFDDDNEEEAEGMGGFMQFQFSQSYLGDEDESESDDEHNVALI